MENSSHSKLAGPEFPEAPLASPSPDKFQSSVDAVYRSPISPKKDLLPGEAFEPRGKEKLEALGGSRNHFKTELALNTGRLEPNEEEITYPICANFISELEAHSLRFNPVPQWPPRNLPSYDHRRVRAALIQTERYPPASVQQEVFSRAHPFIQKTENLDDPVLIEVQQQLSFRPEQLSFPLRPIYPDLGQNGSGASTSHYRRG